MVGRAVVTKVYSSGVRVSINTLKYTMKMHDDNKALRFAMIYLIETLTVRYDILSMSHIDLALF